MTHHDEREHSRSLSVIVPTRDGGSRAADAVAGVLDDTATSEVVVVLDRAGPPGRAVAALADTDPRVRVVTGAARGPAQARATGAGLARGDILLFLDDDVVAGPLLATGHLRAHAHHDHAVVVGTMPVSARACRGNATARVYARDYGRVVARYTDGDAVLFDLWGGNLSIRRDECLAVGMTNRDYVHAHHEDRDFGLRCHAAGLTGVYDEELRAEHRYTRSVREFLDLAREQVHAGRALYALHEDALGPWRPERYLDGLPPRLAAAIDGVARLGVPDVTVAALCALGAVARLVQARRWEDRSVWVARAVVQHAAARVGDPRAGVTTSSRNDHALALASTQALHVGPRPSEASVATRRRSAWRTRPRPWSGSHAGSAGS